MNTISFHQRMMLVADTAMGDILGFAKKAAQSDATVLICGESGTGKELIARFIHEMSNRKKQPFLSVNCAAIPEGLMEAELFGYEKGAFTGAWVQRIGKFEKAIGGTLLLDEVTEMPTSLQTKLLRVIQESEIDRLGGKEPIQIDTRIIATSNREPVEMVKQGQFREDLYYRLNVLKIDCPPLRGRKEAISNLSQFFLEKHRTHYGKSDVILSEVSQKRLLEYHWPGNIRELSNVIERCVLMCDELEIPSNLIENTFTPRMDNETARPAISLAEIEKEHIQTTLDSARGNKTEAAKILGISVRTLRNKLQEYERVS
jgi:two-component system response regulator FlrC